MGPRLGSATVIFTVLDRPGLGLLGKALLEHPGGGAAAQAAVVIDIKSRNLIWQQIIDLHIY